MREVLSDRLPEITEEEWKVVKGSSDFYGMNTYTTNLCREWNKGSRLSVLIYCYRNWW